jgi:hypothetical protein
MLAVEIQRLLLTTAKVLITRPNRVKRVNPMLAMEIRVLILTARRMIWRSNWAKGVSMMLDSLSVKIIVLLNDGRFLMMALLLALELGLVATPACSNFQAEALLLTGLLLLVLPAIPASVLILVLRQCRIK